MRRAILSVAAILTAHAMAAQDEGAGRVEPSLELPPALARVLIFSDMDNGNTSRRP